MKTRLTILCENTVGVPMGAIGEHGFACFVETDHGNYLFDTGQGYGIVQNATVLNRELTSLAAIMISHGHYDHTGGLPAVLTVRGPIDVHGHPDIFIERFRSSEDTTRYIGIPHSRAYLESLGARFRLSRELLEIGTGVYLTGEIPRSSPFEKGDLHMTAVRPNGEEIHPDPINDDLSLVVDANDGLILILGCAHAGLINIIEYVLEKWHRDRIYAVIGGTHLGFAEDEQFEETLRKLDQYRIERIGVSHCTGLPCASRLYSQLGKRFFFGTVGTVLEC